MHTESSMPDDLRNSDLNIGMFLALVSFLSGEHGAIAQFEFDTGEKYTPATSPIDRAIDEATGRDRAIIISFVKWVAVNHWGIEDAPDLGLIFEDVDDSM